MSLIRLNKYLADGGVCSRRQADNIILEGRVSVNGVAVRELGTKVDERTDRVEVDGKRVGIPEEKHYLMLNKPVGVVSTMKDQFGRPSVTDYVKDIPARLFHVGRLDYETSGLILLTNDGEVGNRLMHPRGSVVKEYIANIEGKITAEEIRHFKTGIDIGGYITAPADIEVLWEKRTGTDVRVRIHEGKNRQIRKMFEKLGHRVNTLTRTAIGNLLLGTLKVGEFRHLTEEEVEYLKNL